MTVKGQNLFDIIGKDKKTKFVTEDPPGISLTMFYKPIKKHDRVFRGSHFFPSFSPFKPLQCRNQLDFARDHWVQHLIQYFENIGPQMEQSDWFIYVISL